MFDTKKETTKKKYLVSCSFLRLFVDAWSRTTQFQNCCSNLTKLIYFFVISFYHKTLCNESVKLNFGFLMLWNCGTWKRSDCVEEIFNFWNRSLNDFPLQFISHLANVSNENKKKSFLTFLNGFSLLQMARMKSI